MTIFVTIFRPFLGPLLRIAAAINVSEIVCRVNVLTNDNWHCIKVINCRGVHAEGGQPSSHQAYNANDH